MMAAEADRRRFVAAGKKPFLGDGLSYNGPGFDYLRYRLEGLPVNSMQ